MTRRQLLYATLAAGAAPSVRAQPKRPNILFAIADDWGWPHAGAYGCSWVNTPAFDRVADEGILFANCFTSNPKCSPCRASILTGRNTWQLEEAVSHFGVFPAKWAVFPDLLEESRVPGRLYRQGMGSRRLQGRRLLPKPCRAGVRQAQPQGAVSEHVQQGLRQEFRVFPRGPGARPAFLLLVWHPRAAPSLPGRRRGHQWQAPSRRRCARVLSRRRDHPGGTLPTMPSSRNGSTRTLAESSPHSKGSASSTIR